MKKVKISIGNRKYLVELAETPEDQAKGLSNISELEDDSGMLFLFEEEQEVGFWMKDTLIALDIIFIDEDLVVTKVVTGTPGSEEIISAEASYVLEVNANSGIKEGDELEFEPTDAKMKTEKMLVLNSNGETQMELEGGERIMSRSNTKTLIKFAKKAATTNNDNDYKALGKRVFKFLRIQSETDPEYVQSKN